MIHTPRPWRRSGCTVYALVEAVGSNWPVTVNRFSCLIESSGRDGALSAELEANACLITAAPDLLEALRGMLAFDEWARTESGVTPEHLIGVQDRARAAIAKAEENP